MQNAAARGHLSCVQLLSAHSADRGGNAPQRYAAHFGHHHIVTWLQRSQFWTTPLHHAEIIDRKTAYDLLRGGGNVTVLDDVRFVRDGNVVTSAGISAGMDMSLWLTGQLVNPEFARFVQKGIEYFPAPPYTAEA